MLRKSNRGLRNCNNNYFDQILLTEARIPVGDLTTRIVLGTVQLGLPYGRRRGSPVMSDADAFRILDTAFSLGIRAFDTAEAYGSSADRLRSWIDTRRNADEVKVITKCSVDSLAKSAKSALSRFAGIRDLLLLTHGAVGKDQWSIVLAACRRQHAQAGQSVYTEAEVKSVVDLP